MTLIVQPCWSSVLTGCWSQYQSHIFHISYLRHDIYVSHACDCLASAQSTHAVAGIESCLSLQPVVAFWSKMSEPSLLWPLDLLVGCSETDILSCAGTCNPLGICSTEFVCMRHITLAPYTHTYVHSASCEIQTQARSVK